MRKYGSDRLPLSAQMSSFAAKQIVKSFAVLPPKLRLDLSCVIGGKFSSGFISELKHCAMRWGLSEDSLCFPDFIQDDDLICLYRHCKFFVFPSWHEGFGLPVLEAMACGAPVICSNTTRARARIAGAVQITCIRMRFTSCAFISR